MATTFRDWLSDELLERAISRRELARRLAEQHPQGATAQTIETHRRAIYKYLDPENPTIPTVSTRRAFAAAFGVSPEAVPSPDDDSEGEPDLSATLQALVREHAYWGKRLKRAIEAASPS